ncbi:MAG: glycosyltransferase family 2 protein [Candidatus Hodarchaeota archaeon]
MSKINVFNTVTSKSPISVIICSHSYERIQLLQKLVGQLLQQPYLKEILLIIDHNSNLFTLLEKKYQNDIKIKVLKNQFQSGLSGARNTGVLKSKGKILAFLDDDVILTKKWSENLARSFHKSDTIAGVAGKIIPIWEKGPPNWLPPTFFSHFAGTEPNMTGEKEIPWTYGANMVFWRHIFKEVGGFNLKLGRQNRKLIGHEEMEFCIRIRMKMPSKKIIYNPSATVYHIMENKRKSISYLIATSFFKGASAKLMKLLIHPYRITGNSLIKSFITREELRRKLACLKPNAKNRHQAFRQYIVLVVGCIAYFLGYSIKKL